MAVLPGRLQSILYARLKKYNCVSEQFPEQLAKYGGVAICSGGSYKSLCDWGYLDASLFRADFAQICEWPLIFEVENAPECYLANGPYLRTRSRYNGHPVYAQITRMELHKDECGLNECICNADLLEYLSHKTQNFGHKDLRAGERLIVRHQNAWVVQSVSAFQGFLKKEGSCGFHVLHIPDNLELSATCFAGMSLRCLPIMNACDAKLKVCSYGTEGFRDNSEFRFTFGSRRCVRPVAVPGTDYKPHPTQHQAIHTDGPLELDASSMWATDGKVNCCSDAFRLSYISTLSVDELLSCCQSRGLSTTARCGRTLEQGELVDLLFEWMEKQESIKIPVPDSMLQNLSALCAFFPKTALGVPCSRSKQSLRLSIPIGTAVLFRFDFLHHGWKCVDEDDPTAIPVHFRAHFYLFTMNLPTLPVFNFEALLEYLSVLSQDSMDDATQLLMLECLQTFVPFAHPHSRKSYVLKPLNELAMSRGYRLFASQNALDQHCKNRES